MAHSSPTSAFIVTSPSLTLTLLPPSDKDPCSYTAPTSIIQDILTTLKIPSLKHIHKVPFAIYGKVFTGSGTPLEQGVLFCLPQVLSLSPTQGHPLALHLKTQKPVVTKAFTVLPNLYTSTPLPPWPHITTRGRLTMKLNKPQPTSLAHFIPRSSTRNVFA